MYFRRRHRPIAIELPGVPKAASYIEEGCTMSGQLHFRQSVHIDGRVEGEVRAGGTVIVGESASIEGSIFAESVIVLGEVEGEISASGQVTVFKSGRIHGDIQTAGIAVEPGATLRGCIAIEDGARPALTAGTEPTDPPKDTGE